MRKIPLVQALSDVETSPVSQSMPVGLSLYPNPSTEHATAGYTLEKPSLVTITIFDALGRIASRPVVDAMQESGEHRITLETSELDAGAYHCVMAVDKGMKSVRFVVAR
jgi:hypothetical protein